jgi:hypothetical protein
MHETWSWHAYWFALGFLRKVGCDTALRAVLRPCHGTCSVLVPLVRKKTSLTALRTAIKPVDPSSREHRAAAVLHGCLAVNSTPACFSSPTRVVPHSFRTPCSSYACLLVSPSRRLTGASVPAAATGQPSSGSAPRTTPEPTNHLSASPRPQWSCPCHTLTCSAPVLAGIRAPAAAPPPVRRRRSPATSPVNPPPPIDSGWAQLLISLVCCHPAPHLAAGELAIAVGSRGGEGKGMVVKISKRPGTRVLKDYIPLLCFS